MLSNAAQSVGAGWGFGLHAAMDQTGAVLGPLLMVVMVARTHRFAAAFIALAVPAALALVSLGMARKVHPGRGQPPPTPSTQPLPRLFWLYSISAGVLACGFVDFPLLAYHWQNTGLLAPAVIPLMYAGAMAANGVTALVFGRLFDKHGLLILAGGILVSLLALPLGFLGGSTAAIVSVVCWGTGLGVQDASLRPGIAQVVSMNKRGSAFGAFNAIYGVMWFVGSAVMGLLYDHSRTSLVVFGIVAQLAAATAFFRLRGSLAAAKQH